MNHCVLYKSTNSLTPFQVGSPVASLTHLGSGSLTPSGRIKFGSLGPEFVEDGIQRSCITHSRRGVDTLHIQVRMIGAPGVTGTGSVSSRPSAWVECQAVVTVSMVPCENRLHVQPRPSDPVVPSLTKKPSPSSLWMIHRDRGSGESKPASRNHTRSSPPCPCGAADEQTQ